MQQGVDKRGLDVRRLGQEIERLEKMYGRGVVRKLGSREQKLERLPTGVPQLDQIIGGGLPKGRIIEIYGPESAGKTSLLYQLLGQHKTRAMLDAEGTLDEGQAAVFGNIVGTGHFFHSRPYWGEQAWDILLALATAGVPLIGVDSVPAMIPRAVFERKDASQQDRLGAVAKLMSELLPRLAAICDKTGSTVVFINQERDNIGASLWQEQSRTPGGRALKHMCSLRLQLAHRGFITKTIKGKPRKVGMITKVRVKKSKVAAPQGECEIEHIWGKGFRIADAG